MTAPTYSIKNSPIEGRGLFAARILTKGEKIAEYLGERVSKIESARRQAAAQAIFIFELDDDFDLDGNTPGNPARFINHSCEPNCEAVVAGGNIEIHTLRKIAEGEELSFDYGFRLAVFPGHRCHCGASSCVGFIVGRADRWRMRRLLNRPGRSLLPRRKAAATEVCA